MSERERENERASDDTFDESPLPLPPSRHSVLVSGRGRKLSVLLRVRGTGGRTRTDLETGSIVQLDPVSVQRPTNKRTDGRTKHVLFVRCRES